MPNWTWNTLRVKKPAALRVQELVKGEKSSFDFNKLIPMPESLDVVSGSTSDEALLVYHTGGKQTVPEMIDYLKSTEAARKSSYAKAALEELEKVNSTKGESFFKIMVERVCAKKPEEMEELKKLGDVLIENMRLYGAPTWYEWCVNNWGTKWNACDTEVADTGNSLQFEFTTAWAAPIPIFKELSKQFPDEDIDVEFRNEDGYENIYCLTYRDGEVIHEAVEIDEEYLEEIQQYME